MRARAKEVLVTRYGGYLLDVPPEAVDVHEFERLSRAGQQAYDVEDFTSASRLLRQALEMWRGAAVVDVRPGMPLGIEIVRLEEARLGALEARIDAELRMGKHKALLSELSVLTVQNPMNENLCAQYMISLFRAGRQWQALDAFKGLRNTLIEELGVEPSSRLQTSAARDPDVRPAPRQRRNPSTATTSRLDHGSSGPRHTVARAVFACRATVSSRISPPAYQACGGNLSRGRAEIARWRKGS